MRKTCSKCKRPKPVEDFTRNRTRPDGLQVTCRQCRRAANAKWRSENPEKHRASNARWDAANAERKSAAERAWRAANRDRERAADSERRQRRRARKRAAAVGTIDREALWSASGGRCGICGLEINPNLRHPNPLSRSIDHILPLSKGGAHSQGNVQWAHLRCNLRKGDRLSEPTAQMADAQLPGGDSR